MKLIGIASTILLFKYALCKILISQYQQVFEVSEMNYTFGYPIKDSVYINQFLQYTWVQKDMFFEPIESKIKNKVQLTIDNNTYEGYEYFDVFQLLNDEKTSINFTLCVVDLNDTTPPHTSKGIGFAFQFEDEKYSLVHELKRLNIINYLSFGLSPNIPHDGYGKIYFGGIPFEDDSRLKYQSLCEVSSNFIPWNCLLKSIVFEYVNSKDEIPINQYAFFSSTEASIALPKEIMVQISQKTILKKLIEKKICDFVNDNKWAYFNCKKKFLQDIYLVQSLNFIIGNYIFELPFADLFRCANEYCISAFLSSNPNQKIIVFGNRFLNRYITNFDYERKIILFNSNKPFPKLSNNEIAVSSYDQHIKIILVLLISCLLFNVFLFAYIKYK